MKATHIIFSIILLLWSGLTTIWAHHIETLVKRDKSSLNASTVLTITDPNRNDPGIGTNYVANYTAVAALVYGREDRSDIAGQTWTYTINYDLIDLDNNTTTSSSLSIEHQDNEGVYESLMAHKQVSGNVKIKVTSINGASNVPNDIRLELRLQKERYNYLDATIVPVLAVNPLPNLKQQSELYWGYIEGAEYYEVEWVYWDKENVLDASTITQEELFEQAIRVQTPNNHYTIDMVYPDGDVYFRLRPIGRFIRNVGTNYTIEKRGKWSLSQKVELQHAFEKERNWSFSRAYAEAGKYKQAISYFDDGMKGRQSLTNLSSDDITIIAESVYDVENRPSLAIMPVPVNNADISNGSYLQFGAGTNASRGLITTGDVAYSRKDFDIHNINGNLSRIPALPANHIANQYYSSANAFNNHIHRDYVPDAEGYPIAQVYYDNDSRGYVKSQSGVGAFYQIEHNSRASRYFYVKPTNTELKSLFGDNVGDAKYYRKNYAIDANGQAAVSIVDQAGMTVMTALAGQIPANVQPLDGSVKQRHESIMGSNTIMETDQSSILTHPLFCDTDGANYDFVYDLEQAVNVTNSDHNVCLGCTYNLEIKVEDANGNIVPCVLNTPNPNVTLTGGVITASYVSGQTPCTGNHYVPSIGPIEFSVTFPVLGAYTVYKTLTTTGPNANDILAQLQANGSIVDQQTFIDNYIVANFDSTQCSGCSDAQRQELCERIILEENPNLDLTNPTDLATYQNLVEGCVNDTVNRSCDDLLMADALNQIIGGSDCEAMLAQMKLQLSPGGCLYDKGYYSRALTDMNFPSIPDLQDITTGNMLVDDATTVSIIENATLWQDHWIDDLVTLHPEYCRYQDCISNPVTTASKIFDYDLANYNNWHEAATDLGMSVANPTTDIEKRAIITTIIGADPYISTLPNSSNGQNPLAAFLNTYCTTQCSNTTNPCSCSSSTPDIIDFLSSTGPLGANAPATEEEHWDMFRGAYTNEKLNIVFSNQCSLKIPVSLRGYPSPTCRELTGEPLFNVTTSTGTTTIGLTSGINTIDDLQNLVNSNIYGSGSTANPNTPSLCNQLCEARAEGWIDQLCPSLKANSATNPSLLSTYNALKSQLVNYCLTGCGLATAPTVPTGNPYLANPLGYLIAEDLTKPPFTGNTGVLAIIDALQASPFFECNPGTSSSTLLNNIAVQHNTVYQLNVTYNNVYANLPVQNPKCSLVNNIFTTLNDHLFPVRFSNPIGTVPNGRHFNHTNVPTTPPQVAINLIGVPSKEVYASQGNGLIITEANNDVAYFQNNLSRLELNNESIYDASGNWVGYNRFIQFISKGEFDDPCSSELGLELVETGTMQPINPLEIISIGTYNCTTNTIPVEIVDQSCTYANNNPSLTATACTGTGTQMINAFVRVNIEPCTPSWEQQAQATWVPIISTVTVVDSLAISQCDSAQIAALTQDAQHAYQVYVNSVVNDVLQDVNCMPVVEKMDMSYQSTEQHYTLYYYDQAGNLVHTLPPAAVVPMDMNNYQIGDNPKHNYDLLTTYTYNTLGQIVAQESPDGGLTRFFYDYAQRLRLSQNARQAPTANAATTYGIGGDYAYTKFDRQGRVVEVGKLENYNIQSNLEQLNNIDFPNNAHTLSEQTITVYDEAVGSGSLNQENLRSRVATTYNKEIATHYSYDIHGNVKAMQHQIKKFGVAQLDYEYDLITGNVNEVAFQKGTKDQFFHRYTYDADNRLVKAKTSKNGYSWDTDAHYFYYAHGPLARVELGNDKVQGMDYYYNLQGWIKGVNNTSAVDDMGLDGYTNGTIHNKNKWFGIDEFAYHLGYHKEDYKPIGNRSLGGMATNITSMFDSELRPAAANGNGVTGLYNGNISFMITHIPSLKDNANNKQATNAMVYQYDALHRIKQAKSFHFDPTATQWKRDLSTEWYDTRYTYDANGNITGLLRYNKGTLIDDLHYKYQTTVSTGNNPNLTGRHLNQLQYVQDVIAAVTVGDFENQGQGNYAYDATGNLIKDVSQNIDLGGIQWNLMNKIDKVTYSAASGKTPLEFTYDASGSRLTKTSIVGGDRVTTVYIKDAASNIIATYEMVDEQRGNPSRPGENPITFPFGSSIYAKKLNEVVLYGATRLGVRKIDRDWLSYIEITEEPIQMSQQLLILANDLQQDVSTRGDKLYESSNHLGNVLVTFSDKKLGKVTSIVSTRADYYEAIVTTASDYYPFGWQMPNRKLNVGNYSFGFNGQIQDQEWNGGQSVNFKFRVHDPRLGRFLSVDPLAPSFPWNTPYGYAENDVIRSRDLEGAEKAETNKGLCGGKTTNTQKGGENASNGGQVNGGNPLGSASEKVATVRADRMSDNEAAQRKMTKGGLSNQEKASKLGNRTLMNAFSSARAKGQGADFDEIFASKTKQFPSGFTKGGSANQIATGMLGITVAFVSVPVIAEVVAAVGPEEVARTLAEETVTSITGVELPSVTLKDLIKYKKTIKGVVGSFGDVDGKFAHKNFAKHYGHLTDEYHIVGVHGGTGYSVFKKSPFGKSFWGGNDKVFRIPDDVLSDFVKNHSGWDGKKKILFMSCLGACNRRFYRQDMLDPGYFYGPKFLSAGQKLSTNLNVEVKAAMHIIQTTRQEIKIGPSHFLPPYSKGDWKTLYPGGME